MNLRLIYHLEIAVSKVKQEIDLESRNSYPSIYLLESKSNEIIDLLKSDEYRTAFNFSLIYKREFECFREDLTGSLSHDYERKNKRYRSKWLLERDKLYQIIDALINHVK